MVQNTRSFTGLQVNLFSALRQKRSKTAAEYKLTLVSVRNKIVSRIRERTGDCECLSGAVCPPSRPLILQGERALRKPNFFIVGAPKCGTTSLWSYLKGHPEIYMPPLKEIYFFDTDLWEKRRERPWAQLNQGRAPSLEQYLSCFAAAGEQKRIGEATPSYLRSLHAPHEIKAFSPAAQIIIMLRNPVDMMYALHSQVLRASFTWNRSAGQGVELPPIADFEAELEADSRRADGQVRGYRNFANFPEQVQRYFDLFGRENVHTIIYDDLKENSAEVGRETLRFLGVRPDLAAEFPKANRNEQVRNVRFQRMLVRQPRALRAMSRALIPQWLRSRIQGGLLSSNLVVRPRPPMKPELRRRLQKEFEPKVEQLSTLLGRDLSGWCRVL
jgi:hypothetical protein